MHGCNRMFTLHIYTGLFYCHFYNLFRFLRTTFLQFFHLKVHLQSPVTLNQSHWRKLTKMCEDATDINMALIHRPICAYEALIHSVKMTFVNLLELHKFCVCVR